MSEIRFHKRQPTRMHAAGFMGSLLIAHGEKMNAHTDLEVYGLIGLDAITHIVSHRRRTTHPS